MSKKWQRPLRAIQTNLQITDAVNLDAERLAAQILDLGANALVFNVGGIYAWYPTKVPFHTVNPLMAPGRDLVGEVAEACRRRDVLFFARYDFSKAEDNTYRQHPEWFVRLDGNLPQMVAVDRLGNWPQLVSTCLHGGYQGEEVAYQVLRESMERYRPDGIFITSMIYAPCQCENCKAIYRRRYGRELPSDPREYAPGFAEDMMDESVRRYDRVVKEIDPEAAFLHRAMFDDGRVDRAAAFQASRWWFPDTGEYDLFFDHPIDLVHGETHDALTGGRRQLGKRYGSGAAMKLARCLPGGTVPIDIVHTAPGLNWRHTGLPAPEHRFWMAQVPANGGQIWHSLTGIPDNIPDQEQLESIRYINRRIQTVQPLMHQGTSAAQVAVLWNNITGHGWIEGLTEAGIPYDLLLSRQIEQDGVPSRYQWLICPERRAYPPGTAEAIRRFAAQGGGVVLSGRLEEPVLKELAGVTGAQQESETLFTGYIKIEDPVLQDRAGVAPLLPLAGNVLYCRMAQDAHCLASLVPPFAPPQGSGSPPERAVLPRVETPWPMISRRQNVIYFAAPYHELFERYGLVSHLKLLDALLDGPRLVKIIGAAGVQLSVFQVQGGYLAHLVNGVGERPLQSVTQIHGARLLAALPEQERLAEARWMFSGEALSWEQTPQGISLALPPIDSWEAVYLRTEKALSPGKEAAE